MALIDCPECGGRISDKAPACIHCGYPLDYLGDKNDTVEISSAGVNENKQFCPYCGKEISIDSLFCAYCGEEIEPLDETFENDEQPINHIVVRDTVEKEKDFEESKKVAELQNVIIQRAQLMQRQEQLEAERVQIEVQQRQYESQAKCPKCGSISLSGHKQGFGIGKAVAGAVMFGGVGLLAGGINANKTVVTCLNCGHKFKL